MNLETFFAELGKLLTLLDAYAFQLFVIGFGLIMVFNGWKWQGDKTLARQLAAQRPAPVALQATPRVSILVAAWNEAPLIEAHMNSVLALRYSAKEYIVCAGGDDGTYEIARRYASNSMMVLEQKPGEGKQRALRHCLERASGEIIFLTDADCVLSDEAFERTLEAIVNARETVTTGTSKPLSTQQTNEFVLYQWAIQLASVIHTGQYSSGILGRNCAITRSALEASGGFTSAVRTGTDYYLARQLLKHHHRLRFIPNSQIETQYPQTLGKYTAQHARWLRNLILHSASTRDWPHIGHAALTGSVGLAGLALPWAAMVLHQNFLGYGWLWLVAHSLAARVRYLLIARELGAALTATSGYYLPIGLLADWATAVLACLEALFPTRRWQW